MKSKFERARQRIERSETRNPDVVPLARLACLAVRVEPFLLRRLRTSLLPNADVGTEADLWFSPMVESRGVGGIVLNPDVVHLLREDLAADHDCLEKAWCITEQAHAGNASSLRLEERINFLALSDDTDVVTRIDQELRPALRAIYEGGDRGWEVVQWAIRALPRFHPTVHQCLGALTLRHGVAARLGWRRIVADPPQAKADLRDISWILPENVFSERSDLGVELVEGGVRFRKPDAGTPTISVPRTSPIVLTLSWGRAPDHEERVVEVAAGKTVVLGEAVAEVTLETVAGDRYILFPVTSTVTPLQLPPGVEKFTGRKTELEKLLKELQPDRVIALCGPGGIGKTALAYEAIRQLVSSNEPPDRFPDGIVFLTFHGRPSLALACEHIVKSFEMNAQDTSRETAMRVLARKQALLILDGAEEAEDLSALLEIRGRCGVLVTTRKKEDAEAGRLDIAPLSDTDGAALLRRLAGDWIPDAGEGTDIALEICRYTGGLPLAIRIAGHYLATQGMRAETYLEGLKDSPLAALDQGDRRKKSVRVLLEQSIAQIESISAQTRDALALTSRLALAPFDRAAIVSALDLSPFDGANTLGHLFNYGLLSEAEGRYEVSHPLIHTYARKHLTASGEAIDRLTAYFITLSREEGGNGPEGYARLDADRIHLMRILAGCIEREAWEPALKMVSVVEDYLDRQGYWIDRVKLLKTGFLAAKQLDNKQAMSAMMGNLGLAYNDLGQVEKAIEYYEQALVISREIGYRQGEGKQLGNLGLAYSDLGQVEKAIEYYEQALAISREILHRQGEGNQLGSLGAAYQTLGQVDKAIEYYEQALAISREIVHRQGEGNRLGNLGNAYQALGQVEKAIEYFDQALTISREIGYRKGEGNDLGNLGNAYRALGQLEKAIGYYEQGLTICREIGYRQGEGSSLGNLGNAYSDLGQVEKAAKYFDQALTISREIGYRQGEGNDLGNLMNAYRALGQPEKAIGYYKQGLDQQEEGSDLGNQGGMGKIFISYNHKDEKWKDLLVTHLNVLGMSGLLEVWDDRRIQEGEDWKPAIEGAVKSADVAILMISANFLTSNFILQEEVPALLKRRSEKGILVVPLIVKPCPWQKIAWLSAIQARPKDSRPLSGGDEHQINKDLSDFAGELLDLLTP